MQRLSEQSLSQQTASLHRQGDAEFAAQTLAPTYTRSEVEPGIVHFGVGNFHRCHQAVYVDDLLQQGHLGWGIIGVSLRSSTIRDKLAPQNFLYSEVTLGQNTQLRVIGSILNILVAPHNPQAVINQVADSRTKLVTTTITEKGYYLAAGKLESDNADILADMASLAAPVTIYGYLAAAIIRRFQADALPLNILCCDNINAGGQRLHDGVEVVLEKHDKRALRWMREHVSFCSSMVDRVSPATTEPLKDLVRSTLGLDDAWPVSGEPYRQWVIENRSATAYPPFATVGALMAEDVKPFEEMKLRFLNAGHSMISVLGYLVGYATVHEALEDDNILHFVVSALQKNILPVATLPVNFSGQEYIADVMARFTNSALPYTVAQVNTDSSQKIQQRWFPSIDDALSADADTEALSSILGAWIVYIQRALAAAELNDPLATELSAQSQKLQELSGKSQQVQQAEITQAIREFLTIAGAARFKLSGSTVFMEAVASSYTSFRDADTTKALSCLLENILQRQKEITHA